MLELKVLPTLKTDGVKKKKKNRIIESLQLEGIYKGHLVQLPCCEQEHA